MKIVGQADSEHEVHHASHGQPRRSPIDTGPVRVIRDPAVVHSVMHRAGGNPEPVPVGRPVNLGTGITVRPSSESEMDVVEADLDGCMYREGEPDNRPAWAQRLWPEGRQGRNCPGLCHWARRVFLGAED
jgi:hypothetical protein